MDNRFAPGKPHQEALARFTRITLGNKTIYLQREIASSAAALITEIDRTIASGRKGAGNRASGYPVNVEGVSALFARRFRRGGLIRLFGDNYLGFGSRMIRELALTWEARRRGVPVAEVVGAIVESVAPAIYRGVLITRAMPGMTLWELVQTDDDPQVREHLLTAARRAIDTMHEKGVFHGDLNLHNLFVSTAGDQFSVVILDLDKSRLYPTALSEPMRRRNMKRLARSVRKLDPSARYIDADALGILTG